MPISKEKMIEAAATVAKERNETIFFGSDTDGYTISTIRKTIKNLVCTIEPDGSITFTNGIKISV